MKKYKIAFAQFPGSGSSRMETNAWVTSTVRKMDKDPQIAEIVSLTYATTPITMARNRSVLDARHIDCDYLLMIDSDMAPDVPGVGSVPFWEAAWPFMMKMRQDEEAFEWMHVPPATIGVPYCGPPPHECTFVFQWATYESDTPNPNFRLEMIPREWAAIKTGIEEVAALPTGLILYDMRVFDILCPPYFAYEYSDKYQHTLASTEDVYQTRNASLLKLPQFCCWDSWAGHVKTKIVMKPQIVTRDQVHASLVEAVERNINAEDRLVILKPAEEPKVEAFAEYSKEFYEDRRI